MGKRNKRKAKPETPDALWWCLRCPGPILYYGIPTTVLSRCPECHGSNLVGPYVKADEDEQPNSEAPT